MFAPVGFPECLLEWRMCQRAPASGLAPRVSRYSDGEISHAITNSKGKQRITFPIASASFSYGTGQAKVTQLGRRRRLAYARRLSLQPATAPTNESFYEASPPATAPTNTAADEGVRRLASVFPPLEQ